VDRKFAQAVFVIGPTASGKTAFAHQLFEQLAQQFNRPCGLVNLDAYQFYRGVDIGTAKPSDDELRKYDYRGIDILDPQESIDAARYAEFVWSACREFAAAGQLPVCVGGSGLYLRSILHGLDVLPPRNDQLRDMFRASANAWGWPVLHGWLNALAPERAAQLHPNDKTRIERALEIVFQLPESISPHDVFRAPKALSEQELLGDCYVIHVDCADDILKKRIEGRIEQMFSAGWLEEVQTLKKRWGTDFLQTQAGKAIGYSDIFEALELAQCQNRSLTSKEIVELKSRIATLTWQYVRRQRTWNAKEVRHWTFDSSDGIAEIQFDASFLSFLERYRL